MNLNKNPTIEQIGALLACHDDDAGAYVLWVDKAGEVQIERAEEAELLDARLQYAPFEAGVGFVGEDAASDPELLADLLNSLVSQWSEAKDAPPGTIIIDLDNAEDGPAWTMTDVVTVDDALLAAIQKSRLH